MRPRKRFIFALLLVALVAAFCGARVYSQDRAKPRDGGKPRAEQGERRRGGGEARQPRAGRSDSGRRGDDNRGDYRSNDAERRHPQPDGRFDRDRSRDWGRYDRRYWRYNDRWQRDRFPRYYPGFRLFDGYRYRGRPFGPHHGLWYRDGYHWRLFYWPFLSPPSYGCGWYYVPTERTRYYDPYTGEEYWDYTDYRYVYLCID